MRANLAAGLGVAAVAAFFGAGLPFIDGGEGYSGLSQRFLPIIVTLGLALCATMLLFDPRAVPAQPEDAPDAVEPQRGMARLATVASGLLLHLALIGTIGFILASTLLMVLVARSYGSRRPARDALVALGLTIPMWLAFAKVLGVSLPLLPLAGA